MFGEKNVSASKIAICALAAAMTLSATACGAKQEPAKNSNSSPAVTNEASSATSNSSTASNASNTSNTSNSASAAANASNTTSNTTSTAKLDVASLQWVPAQLDCYNYTSKTGPCKLSFSRPASFTANETNDSGEQLREYYANADPSKNLPKDAQYDIIAYFMQGGYGPRQETLEPSVEGGFQHRQLGGRDVLFGKMAPVEGAEGDPNAVTFCYYVPYDDEGYARIWILLVDQEENGLFRQTFENSMSFV